MKKLNKKTIIVVCSGMLVAAGSYLTYLQAQPQEQMSDLTLANIEAMALDKDRDVHGAITCQGEGRIYCPLTQSADYHRVLTIELD